MFSAIQALARPMEILLRPIQRRLSRYVSSQNATCECTELARKVEAYIINSHFRTEDKKQEIERSLKELTRDCKTVSNLKHKWSSYNLTTEVEATNCKVYKAIAETLPLVASRLGNLKAPSYLSISTKTELGILTAEPGKVSLAGESGALVGKKGTGKIF